MTVVRWLNLHPKEVQHEQHWDVQVVHWLLAPKPWSDDSASRGQLHQQGAIVVIAGQFHASEQDIAKINEITRAEPWVVFLVTSDEESLFNVDLLSHPNRKVWVQSHKPGIHDQYEKLPMGWSPHVPQFAAKDLDWTFMGQVTHSRRTELSHALRTLRGGESVETAGFAMGATPDTYMEVLARAKVAPAPSGPFTVDSFRLYEALRSGCIPVVEIDTPEGSQAGYWTNLFGDHPLTVVESWRTFPEVLDWLLSEWPKNVNEIGAWWIGWKRELHKRLWQSVREVGG